MNSAAVTLGLSSHRPEMVSILSEWMQRHQAIFLEEPPAAGFNRMLQYNLAMEDYIMPLDLEYPSFSRKLYQLLRDMNAAGKTILQVEPYLEVLIGIHEDFAGGRRPDEIDKKSIQYPVYLAEKRATSALIGYYQASVSASFEEVVEAVCSFARADAARFRLRDSLRAQDIVRLLRSYNSVFIEAGEMHYPLWQILNRSSAGQRKIKLVFLAAELAPSLEIKRYLYGPGDRLTLIYIFHPNTIQKKSVKLLAAQSLIHAKMVQKEEMAEGAAELPHLREELKCNRIVNRLSWNDCRRLFDMIRRSDTRTAYQTVVDDLTALKGLEVEYEAHTV